MASIEPWENSWLQGQKKAGLNYFRDGSAFARWKREPGVALLVYAQIQKKFGWEPFIQVFGEYERLTAQDRPRTEEQKIDQCVIRMSQAVRRDLRPLFRKWGWPLGQQATDNQALNGLKKWMPDFSALEG